MASKVLFFVFALVVVQQAAAQVVGVGDCPNVPVVTGFDAGSFIGTWYEQESSFSVFQAGGRCTTAVYGTTDQANVVSVNNTLINALGATSQVIGTATLEDSEDGAARLSVNFEGNPITAPYWVLDTDYVTFAAIWSCNDLPLFNTQNAWVLTRERNASPEVIQTARDAFTRNGIDASQLQTTDQTNC